MSQPLLKNEPVRLTKLRKSAEGQDCTVKSPWCNYDWKTVVLAHYNEPGHGKMGGKEDDTSAVYACSKCHDWLDGRFTPPKGHYPWADKQFFWFRAMRATWKLYIENEVLK